MNSVSLVPPRHQNKLRGPVAVVVLIFTILGVSGGCQSRHQPPGSDEDKTGTESFVLPAEFQAQDALVLGATMLAQLFPQVLVDIVRATHLSLRVVLLVSSSAEVPPIENLLTSQGVPRGAVEFLELPIKTMWIRDYGPVTVVDALGGRRMVGFVYRERRGNKTDNEVPRYLANLLDIPLIDSALMLEGGDFVTNGWGLFLGSTRIVKRNAYYLHLEPENIIKQLGADLGMESAYLLEPLQGETTGHLDMFCGFLKPDLLVVGQYHSRADSTCSILLDQSAESLAGVPTLKGPLRVVRIPMPPVSDGVWRTYTNFVFANDVMLVPIYPDFCPDLDAEALGLYRSLMPGKKVIGIDASSLIKMRGALRCVTMNIPVARTSGLE